MEKPVIWIVDTSVFMNVLDAPGFNQDRESILSDFESRIQRGDSFFLPYEVIIESGNHIAQLHGNLRFSFAETFVRIIQQVISGQTPWKPIKLPTLTDLTQLLEGFPARAATGTGFTDHSLIKEWEEQKDRFSQYSVRIWSLDKDLSGYASSS